MKKRKSTRYAVLFAILTMSLLFTACKKGKDGEPVGILNDNLTGSMGGKTQYQDVPTVVSSLAITYYSDMAPEEYELKRAEDGTIYVLTNYGEESSEILIDKSYMADVDKWIDTYDIRSWDGFSMTDMGVMDGGGFRLEVKLETGESIYASGSNAYPDNYGEASKAIRDIISSAEDEAMIVFYSDTVEPDKYADATSLTDEMFDEFANYPWQKAYKKVLEENDTPSAEDEDAGFIWQGYFLYDIDKDDIPELFIKSGTCEADFLTEVYYFDGTEAKPAGELPSGHTTYYTYPDGNGIIEFNAHMATGALIRTQFDGEKLVLPGSILFEDDLYNRLPLDPDADYVPVEETVKKSNYLCFNSLSFTYGLLQYDKPLVTTYGSDITENEFEEKVKAILGTSDLFYGVMAENAGSVTTCSYGREMGMLELYEREGLFENSEGSTILDDIIFDDFNGDGREEALATFHEDEYNNIAAILFACQNGQVYGYITLPMFDGKIEVENGHIYLNEEYSLNSELVFNYYLDQCETYRVATNHMIIGDLAKESLELFRQDVRGDKGELAVAYLGNAGNYSGKLLFEVLRDAEEDYYDEGFMAQARRMHTVKQPGEEVYMLVPARDRYTISVYEQIWGEDTADGMPERGRLLYQAEPGDIVLVRGNQSDIVSNLEIVMDMDGEELVYNPCLSLENGKLQKADGIVDFTRYND